MMNKKTVGVLLAVIMLTTSLFTVFTSAFTVDLNRGVSLEVTDLPFAGMTFNAYLVAEFNEYGGLTPSSSFPSFNSKLNSSTDYPALYDTLLKEIFARSITPDAIASSDEYGNALFNSLDLKHGLYFVTGDKFVRDGNVYSMAPFLTTLPFEYDDGISYEVVASAKFDILPLVDNYTVCKVWDDEGAEEKRPSKIDVVLYCDGSVYDEISLPHDGSWEYEWKELPSDHTWWIEEKEIKDYKSVITHNGTAFVIKNTFTGTVPPVVDIPSTGQLWWPVPILLCIGSFFVILGLIRRKKA